MRLQESKSRDICYEWCNAFIQVYHNIRSNCDCGLKVSHPPSSRVGQAKQGCRHNHCTSPFNNTNNTIFPILVCLCAHISFSIFLSLTHPLTPSEKVRLQDDIRVKQELIKTRKGEVESLQHESNTVMRQREELEREKGQYLAKLDQLDTEV